MVNSPGPRTRATPALDPNFIKLLSLRRTLGRDIEEMAQLVNIDVDQLRDIEQGAHIKRRVLLFIVDSYVELASALVHAKQLPPMMDDTGRPRVYWWRDALGLNATEAAAALRCDRQDIVALEDGSRPMPSELHAARWLAYLKWSQRQMTKLRPEGHTTPKPSPRMTAPRKELTGRELAEIQRHAYAKPLSTAELEEKAYRLIVGEG
jgi:hypothetical protein